MVYAKIDWELLFFLLQKTGRQAVKLGKKNLNSKFFIINA